MKKHSAVFSFIIIGLAVLFLADLCRVIFLPLKPEDITDKRFTLDCDIRIPPLEERMQWNTNYKLNSLGLRNEEVPRTQGAKEVRILFMGDSCAFGTQAWVGQSQTYPKICGKLLQTEFPSLKITAINGGLPGYSSFQGYRLLKILEPAYHPDIVTVCYGWNDHWEDRFSDRQKVFLNYADYYLNKSAAFYILKLVVKGSGDFIRPLRFSRLWESVKAKDVIRVSPDEYRENISNIIGLCRAKHIKVVLFTAPSNPDGAVPGEGFFETQPFRSFARHPAYNEIVRELARRHSTGLFDLDAAIEAMPYRRQFFADFAHFNGRGHELVARLFLKYAEKEKLVSLPVWQ